MSSLLLSWSQALTSCAHASFKQCNELGVDMCVQAVPPSPLLATNSVTATERGDNLSSYVKPTKASLPSETTHATTAASDKTVTEPQKLSGIDSVEDSVPSKGATSLFTDDDAVDDLFEPSKVHLHFILSCLGSYCEII